MNNQSYNNRGQKGGTPEPRTSRPSQSGGNSSPVGHPGAYRNPQGTPPRSRQPAPNQPIHKPVSSTGQPNHRTDPRIQNIRSNTPGGHQKRSSRLFLLIAAVAAIILAAVILTVSLCIGRAVGSGNGNDITADPNAAVSAEDGQDRITAPDINRTADSDDPKRDVQTSAEIGAHFNNTEEPEQISGEWQAELEKTPDAGQDYIDRMVFLGDSTTYGLRYYKMLEGGRDTTQVWTPANGTLALFNVSSATVVYPETDESITIKEALTLKQPEYLVITLGVNGISTMDETDFKAAYAGLIDMVREVSPTTKIICQTMFPVASNYKSVIINNEKIMRGNGWILDVAKEKNVKFLDTYSVLVGDDGWLPQELQNGDGLHLNAEGFAVELENIRTHAYP